MSLLRTNAILFVLSMMGRLGALCFVFVVSVGVVTVSGVVVTSTMSGVMDSVVVIFVGVTCGSKRI